MIGTPYNSFGVEDGDNIIAYALRARRGALLSGYLAGRVSGGEQVTYLEIAWTKIFRVKHAIAVNSATSGLLAAAFASDLNNLNSFICPAMTMSATAAAPSFTGARPVFRDVSDRDFALDLKAEIPDDCRAVFVTNLFGQPGPLDLWRLRADEKKIVMIEDNSQSPFAMEHGRYAGTIGHIGVFSLNVHKHIQCGEGGMIVTNDDDLAERMRAFINHGEHMGNRIGLNLRMPEICAVIALSQLQQSVTLMGDRREQAEAIIDAIGFIPGLEPPQVHVDRTHVYYTIPFLIDRSRGLFCNELRSRDVPVVEGYVEPLYRMEAFERYASECLVAADLNDKRLFYIENCAFTFKKSEIKKIGEAFKRAAEAVKL